MQLVNQDIIILEDESEANLITIEDDNSGYGKISCHTANGKKDEASAIKDKSDDEDCALALAFTEDDFLLGSQLHNRPLFVTGYAREQKVNRMLIDGGSGVNILPPRVMKKLGVPIDELGCSRLMIQGFNQEGQRALGTISRVLSR
ncbi:hypothetical protein OROMI_028628 [Orobanche minor]